VTVALIHSFLGCSMSFSSILQWCTTAGYQGCWCYRWFECGTHHQWAHSSSYSVWPRQEGRRKEHPCFWPWRWYFWCQHFDHWQWCVWGPVDQWWHSPWRYVQESGNDLQLPAGIFGAVDVLSCFRFCLMCKSGNYCWLSCFLLLRCYTEFEMRCVLQW